VVTVVLKEVSCGTDVSIEQAGLPDIIPQEMCHLGWQDSLEQLRKFVEV
jgi:Activator of Hsp90 ATPase homolog 1-like protein